MEKLESVYSVWIQLSEEEKIVKDLKDKLVDFNIGLKKIREKNRSLQKENDSLLREKDTFSTEMKLLEQAMVSTKEQVKKLVCWPWGVEEVHGEKENFMKKLLLNDINILTTCWWFVWVWVFFLFKMKICLSSLL